MIFFVAMFFISVSAFIPLLIGMVLFTIFSSESKPHPVIVTFWAILSGINIAYTGNFFFNNPQMANVDTGTIIANAFNQSLPAIFEISALLIVLAGIAMVLIWWMGSVEKVKRQLLDEAKKEAATIREKATGEAKTIKSEAGEAAAKIKDNAVIEADMETAIAAESKQEAHEAMRQVEIRRHELEAEYREKETELMRKRQGWLDELAGVKADRDLLKERLTKILKGSVDHWEKEGNIGAANRRKKQLKRLEEEGDDERLE